MEYNFGIFLLQIDLLHGISLSVGRRFRQQCSIDSAWQGQLEKQDIILLTKLIRTKTGDSLYNQIGEEQATVQIPPSGILKLQGQCSSGQTIIDEIRKILPPGYLVYLVNKNKNWWILISWLSSLGKEGTLCKQSSGCWGTVKEQAKRLKIEQKLEDVMRDSGKQKRTVQRKIQKIREKKQQEYKKRDKEVQTKRNVSLITPNSTRQG